MYDFQVCSWTPQTICTIPQNCTHENGYHSSNITNTHFRVRDFQACSWTPLLTPKIAHAKMSFTNPTLRRPIFARAISRNVVAHHKPLHIFAHAILVGTSNKPEQFESQREGACMLVEPSFLGFVMYLMCPQITSWCNVPNEFRPMRTLFSEPIKNKHAMESSSLMTMNTCFKTK